MHIKRSAMLAVALALISAACGGGGGGGPAAPANVPPVVGAIDDQSRNVGDSWWLAVIVTDPDRTDVHTVTASSSDAAVVTVSVDGKVLNLTGTGAGTATITVTARDSAGAASAAVTFDVTIEATWTPGVFEDAAQFKDLCAVPRVGNDPDSGTPYPDRQGATVDENNWLRSWSNDTYLWYDEIEDADPACCDTPTYFGLMRTMETTASGAPKDRFHYSEDTAQRNARVRSGISAGYGARFAVLERFAPRDVRVAFTEPDSPATAADVALLRGTELLEVDGVDIVNANTQADVDAINAGLFPRTLGESHEFLVRDPGAETARAVTMESAEVTTDPVQHVRVLETDTGAVGYMLFNTFATTIAERRLVDSMQELADAGVADLVIDMRYNGGGFLAIAGQLGYMIAGDGAAGRVFSELEFNDKHQLFNPITGQVLAPSLFITTTLGWSTPDSGAPLPALDLERVFVLSGPGTCSASELVVNAMRGIDVEVVLIGAPTCGKPYGFYPEDNCGTTYSTVQFKSVNAKGFGDYADGFAPANSAVAGAVSVPGCAVFDDFDHQFGDPAEARLAAALEYRTTGTCPEPTGAGEQALAESIDASAPSVWTRGETIALPPGEMPAR